jgi:hypothetical protein
MSCTAESHKLEDFEKKVYERRSSDTNDYRPKGIKIIKAVKLYSEKDVRKETRMKLEELLGKSVTGNEFTDSAWGCPCKNNCSSDCSGNCNWTGPDPYC